MRAKIVHAAFIFQDLSLRLWPPAPVFETIPAMAPKAESAESTAAVARRLRLTREAFGMKKAAWCRFVGITPQAWSNVEGTKNVPATNRISLEQALLVCRATGVSLDWIYRGLREGLPLKVALDIQHAESTEKRKAG